jgi:hypothetical protein
LFEPEAGGNFKAGSFWSAVATRLPIFPADLIEVLEKSPNGVADHRLAAQ